MNPHDPHGAGHIAPQPDPSQILGTSPQPDAAQIPGMPPQPQQVAQYQQPYYMMPYTMPYAGYQMTPQPEKEVNQLPLIGMILSLIAIPFLITATRTINVPLISMSLSLAAITVGHLSLAHKPRSNEVARGTPMALTALIIGYLILSISVVWAIMSLTTA